MKLPSLEAATPFGRQRTLPSDRGLFIIGAARSGTTVLQNALNHSPNIFLLGEPDLHEDDQKAGFAARYNAMHKEWQNQATKSTFLPNLLSKDGTWKQHLCRLGESHRWVGSKIVINAGVGEEWINRLLKFQQLHFYGARYIFIFRRPVAVIKSTVSMRGADTKNLRALSQNYASVVSLFTHMFRTMPHVRAEIFEDMNADTFEELSAWLGVSLSGAADYYRTDLITPYDQSDLQDSDRQHIADLEQLYAMLREARRAGFPRPQLEQNDLKVWFGKGAAPLGHIDAMARKLANPSDV